MSAGLVVVIVFAMFFVTILIGLGILVWAYREKG